MNASPLISVIIPAYNAADYIRQAIESALAQTYSNIEVLVVDDGSTDTTPEIVNQFAHQDSRVILLQQPNAGVAAARNLAISQSHGEFIAPLDADDIWLPECLEAQLELMAEPKVGMVYAWSVFIDEEGQLTKTCQSNRWEGSDYFPLIYRNLPGNASCVLLRRRCVQFVGGYDSSYRALSAQGCEDWDLYLRIAQHCEVRVVPRLLVGYRQVDGSMSSNPEPMRRGVDLILKRLAQRHPEISSKIYNWNRSNFAWYCALKCNRVGNYQSALVYMKDALALDYFPLLRVSFYRLGLAAMLKILFHPVTSWVWTDHRSWVDFQKAWAAFFRSINPFYQEISLDRLQQRQLVDKQRFPWRQYEMFIDWRCDRIRQQAQKNLLAMKSDGALTPNLSSEISATHP